MSSVLPTSVYTDFGGLESLKNLNDKNINHTQEAAKQFEALFLQMVLKSMREANQSMKSDLFESHEQDTYEEMYHQQLALNLADKGTLGLSEIIARQLSPQGIADPRVEIPRMDYSMERLRFDNRIEPSKPTEVAVSAEIPKVFETPEDFVSALMPYAEKAAQRLGIDPRILVSQAALETGWGKSVSEQSEPHFNLFGIKAQGEWKGDSVLQKTHEYEQGRSVLQEAWFKKYDSFEDSFMDYVNHLTANPRYEEALASSSDPNQFIEHLQKSGYATDPNYAEKIKKIFWSPTIQQF